MGRALVVLLFFVACVWFLFGWIAAKAEVRYQRRILTTGPIVKSLAFTIFAMGLVGYLGAWVFMEDEMREVHNMPPRQYKSKAYRKTWTERFFGE